MPHTQFCKGKRVFVRLVDGTEHVGKFIEKKGRHIRVTGLEFTTAQVQYMGFYRPRFIPQ